MDILEKEIERKLIRTVQSYGGRCLKWTCPGWSGVPDRILLFPGGHVSFVELKRPKGGRITPLQKWWNAELLRLGFLHFFIYDQNGIEILEKFLQVWAREGFAE